MPRPLREMTWEEVRDLDPELTVALLPVGAVEAHGPHLPLGTDDLIAEAMARAGGEALESDGYTVVVLPTISYTSARFAASFPGTVSADPRVVADTIASIGGAIAGHGLRLLALANAHLDPVHLGSLRRAIDALASEAPELQVVFPDVTRRPWAMRLTEEFLSGACHAGRYEGSVVLAERPELVRERIAAELPPVQASLVDAIRAGKTSFAGAGGPRAYFGTPAEATAEEGRETVAVLGGILRDAVREHLSAGSVIESPPEAG